MYSISILYEVDGEGGCVGGKPGKIAGGRADWPGEKSVCGNEDIGHHHGVDAGSGHEVEGHVGSPKVRRIVNVSEGIPTATPAARRADVQFSIKGSQRNVVSFRQNAGNRTERAVQVRRSSRDEIGGTDRAIDPQTPTGRGN